MITKEDAMNNLLQKCDILLDGQVISRELILKKFSQYLNFTAEEKEHNVGIVLHTGSVLFDAISVVYATVSNILLNETDGGEIVRSLSPGDIVIYKSAKKAERWVFTGITTKKEKGEPAKEYAVLKQKSTTNNVPVEQWHKITPYLGASDKLNAVGIKQGTGIREEFFQEVLGFNKHEIQSNIDVSTVLVMSHEKADWLLNSLFFCFNKRIVKLLEIITASYFTENDRIDYPGNSAKTDPVLKICGNISVARQKLLETTGNKNIGIMILGNEIVSRGISEIPALMRRKAIKYVFINSQIDTEHGPLLISEYEDYSLFACTKDFLLSNSKPSVAEGPLIEELDKQTDAIIEREIKPANIQGYFAWTDYRKFIRNVLSICTSDIFSEDKDDYVSKARALMKLFTNAVFGIDTMEKMIEKGRINAYSPSEMIEELRAIPKKFPAYLQQSCSEIIEIIDKVYLSLSDHSPKETWLKSFLEENREKKIAIIVPKAYFSIIGEEIGLYRIMERESNLIITTANRFDNTKVYDIIICVSDLTGRRFDPFRTRSARDIIPVLYNYEANLFKLKMQKAQDLEKIYNDHSAFGPLSDVEYDDILYDNDATCEDISNTEEMDEKLEEYIRQINDTNVFRSFGDYSGNQNTLANIIAVGTFESGHKIFFSQMYKAYVLDEESGEVKEKSVDQLHEGDMLVFTHNNDDTKDIIDELIQKMINDEKLDKAIAEDYYKSKQWKTTLIQYMKDQNMSAKAIAEKMIRNGVSVQEMTIRCWLDEDAHTTGPRAPESIQQIGYLVGDADLYDRYMEYHEACRRTRLIRNRVLKMLGQAIIRNVSGKTPKDDKLFAEVSDRIESLSMILKLEAISDVSKQVPLNVINRPFIVKE